MPRDDENARATARRQTRIAGERSAAVARDLMKLGDAMFAKLDLSEEVREAATRARRVTSMTARRRAERELAGELRHADIPAVALAITNVAQTGAAEQARLHFVEKWRERLLEQGTSAVAEWPPGDPDRELPLLLSKAASERDTGKPPGAARALFRHLLDSLKAHEARTKLADAESDDAASDDDD